MIKFLLDANLSPETAKYLACLGFNVKSITAEKLGTLTDPEIIQLAKKEKRIIITLDLDFGEIYHEKEKGKVGIIVLRLDNQTTESVNLEIKSLLSSQLERLKRNPKNLIVYKKSSIRFVS